MFTCVSRLYNAGGLRHRRVGSSDTRRMSREPRDYSGSEDEGVGIIEFSPEAATEEVTEEDFQKGLADNACIYIIL